MSNYIKTSQDIVGLNFGTHEIKIGHYADDTFIFLDGSETSIRAVIQAFETFKNISGLRINVDKTQIIKLGGTIIEGRCPILDIPYNTEFKLLGINFSVDLDQMEELNFRSKLANIKNIMKLYQWQGLSMAGRITIIKMRILPNLIHLLTVLPTPKEKLLGELKKLLLEFLWDKKRPKIQYNTLVQDYGEGGLKMLHLESFCKSLKISWVKKIYNSHPDNAWKVVALLTLKEVHLPLIFEGSIDYLTKKARLTNNLFWKDLLKTLAFYRNVAAESDQGALPYTSIWNNVLIQNNNLKTRKNYFVSHGLVYFKDLYDYDNKCFKTKQDFLQKHGIDITFFDHLCLMRSIPRQIKNTIAAYKPDIIMNEYGTHIHDICKSVKPNKYIYNNLISKLNFGIPGKIKWENSIGRQLTIQEWSNIFSMPIRATLDSKLRIFQYKIIHRILPTNKLLHIYQIRNNPWCDHCPNVSDTLEHTFHLCPRILNIWQDMANWFLPELDIYPILNTENILLGIYNRKQNLENDIMLIVKKYIYTRKCLEQNISFRSVQCQIRFIMNLELNITNMRRREINMTKWAPIKQKIMQIG